jgi:hypothetical protein
MANPTDSLELHAMGAESGAGASSGEDITAVRSAALVQLRVATGTASATVQTSSDGSTWRDVATLGPRTNTLTEELAVDALARYLRVSWPASTAGTFEVAAVAHQLLARRIDLYAKLERRICEETEQLEPGIVARALIEATDVAVGPLGAFRSIDCMLGVIAGTHTNTSPATSPLGAFGLQIPFSALPLSVVGAVASIAALIVLNRHGFVGGGIDEAIVEADKAAREWLIGVGEKSSAQATPLWRWEFQHARR